MSNYVLATRFSVSTETSSASEGATLRVFKVHYNDDGSLDSIEYHPMDKGLYLTADDAREAAYEAGLLADWSTHPMNSNRKDA